MASDNNNPARRRAYRVSLVDAQSHERLYSLRFSRTQAVAAGVSLLVVVVLGIYSLIAFTPIRTFIPGYPDARTRRQTIQNVMRLDSLETKIVQWELYTENLKRVVEGAAPIRLDSLIHLDEQTRGAAAAQAFLAGRDSLLRAEVRSAEAFEISGEHRRLPIEAITFFPPLKGVVSREFEPTLHPWIEISAPIQNTVLSVLDGTVVFSGWDEADGNLLLVQHEGDIVSVYRHNRSLLKKPGDHVKAGTPLAIADPPLRFELWYRGEALDPALYIAF